MAEFRRDCTVETVIAQITLHPIMLLVVWDHQNDTIHYENALAIGERLRNCASQLVFIESPGTTVTLVLILNATFVWCDG